MLYHRYGDPREVMQLEEADAPVAGEGEVVIRVNAASANPVEWHLVRGEPSLVRFIAGLRGPKDPFVGGDGSGVVESVGPGVDGLAVGDAVFGATLGSFAELARAKAARLALKPASLTFEQAACLPVAGCTALQAVRDHGRLQADGRVLVIGAAGGVGSLAIQIAKALGGEVTGVCSTANLEFVRELGADHVVDYTREEPSGSYDVVLQIAGNRSLSQLRRLLTPRGTLVLVGRGVGRDGTGGMLALLTGMVGARVRSRKDGKRIVSFIAKIKSDDLATVAQLAVPAVSKVYALDDAASAVADIEAGHTRGKIAISVQSA